MFGADTKPTGTFPVIPEAGKGKDTAITHTDVVRNLITIDHLPLMEAVCGYQAASALEWGAVGRLLCNRLDTGVDGRIFALGFL